MPETPNLWSVLLSPQVLLTFIVTATLAGIIIWLVSLWNSRQRHGALTQQRLHQEDAIERLLASMEGDKAKTVAEYEKQMRVRDERIAQLEGEAVRLRDRLSTSGLLGLFGGRQREVVSALLLENEQLHELVAAQQVELREMMSDLTGRLLDRIDRQAQESARAVRYKQALLSAFLQQEETRRLLDQMVAEGRVGPGMPPEISEQD